MAPNFRHPEKERIQSGSYASERVRMFQCLVMYISLDKIYYIHTRARYILATLFRLSHVCGVQWSRVWRKSKFLEHSIGGWQYVGAWALDRRHPSPSTSPSRRRGDMDRASQVLAQGVPPGVPRSYRERKKKKKDADKRLY
jgi:hypothetical protein